MENNTGYEMTGKDFQNRYTYEVPKKVCSADDERRISITFRVFNTE